MRRHQTTYAEVHTLHKTSLQGILKISSNKLLHLSIQALNVAVEISASPAPFQPQLRTPISFTYSTRAFNLPSLSVISNNAKVKKKVYNASLNIVTSISHCNMYLTVHWHPPNAHLLHTCEENGFHFPEPHQQRNLRSILKVLVLL